MGKAEAGGQGSRETREASTEESDEESSRKEGSAESRDAGSQLDGHGDGQLPQLNCGNFAMGTCFPIQTVSFRIALTCSYRQKSAAGEFGQQ